MTSEERKQRPVYSGVLAYFPDALAEVAHVSFVSNEKHNPGEKLHWSKHKSADHADCLARHLLEQGKVDDDYLRHTAKVAWRALALLQTELETDAANSLLDTDDFDDNDEDFQEYIDAYPAWLAQKESEKAAEEAVGPLPPPTAEGNDTLEMKVAIGLRNAFPGDTYEEPVVLTRFDDRKDLIALELVKLGCPPEVAKQVVQGITFSKRSTAVADNGGVHRWCYVAGPMRGYVDFNFPAFDAARDKLLSAGYHVISPADMEREEALTRNPHANEDQTHYAIRDFWSLVFVNSKGGIIQLMDGWENSVGATAERGIAEWLGMEVKYV